MNGHDKNWVRVCLAIDGFRARHGRWPTRVRIYPQVLVDICQNVLSTPDFVAVCKKVTFVTDDMLIAEDDTGHTFDYGHDAMPSEFASPRASDWFGVHPKGDDDLSRD